MFYTATVLWGVVGMLVGVTIALQLAFWPANLDLPWTTFGRLRPLHTNAVIFAFAGNVCFTGIYYSMQRLLKTRMFSDLLSRLHFWGWQLIIVLAAVTLPLGLTQAKEYAELIWPIDLLIAVVWVIFAVNFFGTLAIRKVRHMYVAIWFYMSFVITIAVLHIVNNLAIPATLTRSYPVYAGLTDALVQWWYGHNAVGFFLTTPFLGLMYYFLPRAAERPVYSYRLSIVHFWALVFLYIWAGPHHLLFSALPDWAQTTGMVFSIMLLAPSWGGMINGLMTLRGAWDRLRTDPILKFMVVAVSFYGMSTFEGPMMSIRSVNGLAHFTNWVIGHVHSGALGWVGMISFGMLYWLAPRLWGPLAKPKWATTHFWLATIGIVLYTVSMWAAGLMEGLMWRGLDDAGQLKYPNFVEVVGDLHPFYWLRFVGGTLYLVGMLMLAWNFVLTVRAARTAASAPAPAPAVA
ncbi:MAG: cytochrome-c oxidase, cbb3-type subunit I [Gemmatimonadetes bacterium]|nr:cytochrome-c oxidase, cbb3-type subunit I [Gemmatimonadota bacterium]